MPNNLITAELSLFLPLVNRQSENTLVTRGENHTTSDAKRAGEMAASFVKTGQVAALTTDQGHPVVLVTDWIAHLPGIGEDHDWAWQMKPGGGRDSRRAIYKAYYKFPDHHQTSIPHLEVIKGWAKSDVERVVRELYRDQGTDTKNAEWKINLVTPKLKTYEAARGQHSGEWKKQLEQLERSGTCRPFIDTAGGPVFVGRDVEQVGVSTPAKNLSQSRLSSKWSAESDKLGPFWANNRRMIFKGGAVALGAALVVLGGRSFLRNSWFGGEPQAVSSESSSRMSGWSAAEIAGGAGLILLGVLGRAGHGR